MGAPGYYMVRVPAGATLTATMLNAAGGECTGTRTAPTRLRMLNANQATLEEGVGDDSGCPSVTRAGLSAGEYYFALRTVEPVTAFPYQLRLSIDPAAQ